MKDFLVSLLILVGSVGVFAANPAFQSFDTNDFTVIPSLAAPRTIQAKRTGVTNIYQNTYISITNSTVVQNNSTNYYTNVFTTIDNSTTIITNTSLTIDNSTTIITNTAITIDNSTLIVTNTTFIVNGTNVATINPTDNYIPVRTGTNSFGDSSLWQSDSWTVRGTNLVINKQLITDGILATRSLLPATVAAGTNVLVTTNTSMFVLASTATNGVVVELTSALNTGTHLFLVNYWTNAAFTMYEGPLADDLTKYVWLTGDEWTPSESGETIHLLSVPGGWLEVSRSSPQGPDVDPSVALGAYFLPTVVDLRLVDDNGLLQWATTHGNIAPDDGQGRHYWWNASDTSTDDGISIIKPDSTDASAAGRWNEE